MVRGCYEHPSYLLEETMAKTRFIKRLGEYMRGIISEDGVHYRHERQEMDPVLEHVRFLSEKVNEAPKIGNKNDMRYIGSPPWTVVTAWLQDNHYSIDQFARNDDRCSDKFKAWFLSNPDMARFRAVPKKSSQIVVPQ